MTDVTDEANVTLPAVESAQTEGETEAKLNSEIKSLWSAHQASKVTAKQTKDELKALRLELGRRLHEMKSLLVRTGRSGGWAAYLRSHDLPRASVERYINKHEALLKRRQIDSPRLFPNRLMMRFGGWSPVFCLDSGGS
jgi:hypothetical protein